MHMRDLEPSLLTVKKSSWWWKLPVYTTIGLFALIGLLAVIMVVVELGADGY